MISNYDYFQGDEMYCRYCDDKPRCNCNDYIEQKAEEECDNHINSCAFEQYMVAV